MAKIFISWPDYSAEDLSTGGRLVAAGHELVIYPKLGARSEADLLERIEGCSAAIVSTDPFTARVIASSPMLRIIARVGVGTDSIDLCAATAGGVGVSITPGLNTETVADHTAALILALVRRVVEQDAIVKAGRWDRVGAAAPGELSGKTIGLVGAGSIGRAVMRRLFGFGVTVLYCDDAIGHIDGAIRCAHLPELLANADVVSIHLPLTEKSRRLLDGDSLRLMKPTAYLVNTARGGIVDQEALFDALRAGRLAGAALDVFAEEPPTAQSLAAVPNLVVSAHVGGISRESIRRMTASATNSVLAVLSGLVPSTVINPEALLGRGMKLEALA